MSYLFDVRLLIGDHLLLMEQFLKNKQNTIGTFNLNQIGLTLFEYRQQVVDGI